MGRTIPSFRIATEMESWKWKPFRNVLGKKDRKIFDEMFTYARLYNSAGSNAVRPVLTEPIVMSILLEHYKQLKKLEVDAAGKFYSSSSPDSTSDSD